jgi:hypothetical protein
VQTCLRFLLLSLLLATAALRGDDSLAHAQTAQERLGASAWSRVLRIENAAPSERYARVVHALVFEFEGLLWFYAASEGTQSLSLHRGRLSEEKADLGPLLREIHAGFRRWREIVDEPAAHAPAARAAAAPRGALPNGCFIESVAAARTLGGAVERPQLLTYYVPTAAGMRGHTVLTFGAGDRVGVIDSAEGGALRKFSAAFAGDALGLARVLGGRRVEKVRVFPLSDATLGRAPDLVAGEAAALAAPGRPLGA